MIPKWASSLNTTKSPIFIADCSVDAGFTLHMLRDGVHPNDAGDQFIAKQVLPMAVKAINAALKDRG